MSLHHAEYARYRSRWIPAFAGMTMLAVLLLGSPARASQQCYSPRELKAEEWLRLHSQLMVIAVTCHQSSTGQNLVPYYTGFTQEHLKTLHNAEQTLIRHYRVCYGGDGVAPLDRLRTKLGNEYGQEIADQSAPLFCALWRDFVVRMYSASSAQLEAEVDGLAKSTHSYERICAVPPGPLASEGR